MFFHRKKKIKKEKIKKFKEKKMTGLFLNVLFWIVLSATGYDYIVNDLKYTISVVNFLILAFKIIYSIVKILIFIIWNYFYNNRLFIAIRLAYHKWQFYRKYGHQFEHPNQVIERPLLEDIDDY